jgi:DNA-3-methyladenine glycosylase II
MQPVAARAGSPRLTVRSTGLDEDALRDAVRTLGKRDPALRAIVDRYGPPPLWARAPGFPTLVLLILEQQVSLASARAAYDRLVAITADPPTPASLLALTDAELLAAGFSRQKTRYARALAVAVGDGSLDVDGLALLDDDGVDAALTALPGIGPWTSTIYRLMVLGRPDAWPIHDIALAQAYADVHGLAVRPRPEEMTALAEEWRPWRAVAARILWHQYLSVRAERRAARTSSVVATR